MTKWVYSFSAERAEGRGEMKNLLGGKGANLHDMASLGLPVPPGFTITTEVCTHFYANGKTYPAELASQVDAAMAEIGRQTGTRFWRRGQSAARLGALGRARLDARHDGHRPQSRAERRLGRNSGENLERRAFRLQLVPPLHSDVFECRSRHRRPQFRGHPRAIQGHQRLRARHRLKSRRLALRHCGLQSESRGRDRQAVSRKRRAISSGARSARCSHPG